MQVTLFERSNDDVLAAIEGEGMALLRFIYDDEAETLTVDFAGHE